MKGIRIICEEFRFFCLQRTVSYLFCSKKKEVSHLGSVPETTEELHNGLEWTFRHYLVQGFWWCLKRVEQRGRIPSLNRLDMLLVMSPGHGWFLGPVSIPGLPQPRCRTLHVASLNLIRFSQALSSLNMPKYI